MERKYTADDGIKFLNLAHIQLPSNEISIFTEQFNNLYQSNSRYESFVGTLWDIYSNILPFKAHPERDGRTSYFEHLSREEIFHDNVIKTGLDKKINKGMSIEEIVFDINKN